MDSGAAIRVEGLEKRAWRWLAFATTINPVTYAVVPMRHPWSLAGPSAGLVTSALVLELATM